MTLLKSSTTNLPCLILIGVLLCPRLQISISAEAVDNKIPDSNITVIFSWIKSRKTEERNKNGFLIGCCELNSIETKSEILILLKYFLRYFMKSYIFNINGIHP